jgi:hypothetical protein
VISLHFVQQHFRHQDTKTQSLIFSNSFALGLGAWFVAICSGLSGLGTMYSLLSRLQATDRGMIQEPGDFSMASLSVTI